uniref:Translation elongation factor EF1B beta/delta subunit guanine nucleotide exchange domain-containing protein n=1 Tax=Ditylenchus dipsaci TaxID=166011 RepID=A0A915E600_9BILA
MSAQSLLSEVPSNLATQHVIKSADQLYFKDKQVYTQPQTEVLHSAGAKATGSDNKEKLTSGSESQPLSAVSTLQNKLKEGIEAVYKTVDHALHGDTTTTSNASSTDVEALRKDVANLKTENQQLHKEIAEIRQILQKLTVTCGAATTPAAPAAAPATSAKRLKLMPMKTLTCSAQKARRTRRTAYAEKKSKKPGVIAKSSVILDIKPWEDTTNMVEMEEKVRTIELDGLLWGAAKLVPIGYGIKKLQIVCTVEDLKVSVDDLIERIEGFEDHVQSVDVVAFNKI